MPRVYVRKTSSPEELSQALAAGGRKNKGVPKSAEARKKLSETRKRRIAEGSIRCDNSKIRDVPPVEISESYGAWLSGFVDGEACFYAGHHPGGGVFTCFKIALRRDDKAVLLEIRDALGFGRVRDTRNKTTLLAAYEVTSRAECLAIAGIFRKYPLRSKKAEDWLLWESVVSYCFNTYNPRFADVEHLVREMKVIKHGEIVICETA